jgi:hypothetical protein
MGTITSHLNWTHWTQNETTTYGVGNVSPVLGQAQKCEVVKPVFVNLTCIIWTPVYSEHKNWSQGGLV